MKIVLSFLQIILIVFLLTGCFKENIKKPVSISLWIENDKSGYSLNLAEKILDDFSGVYNNIIINITIKDSKNFHNDFKTAALAGISPDLLWTNSDQTINYAFDNMIQPVDDFITISKYLDPIITNEKSWTIPTSTGNHLMLMVNKEYVPKIPEDSDSFLNLIKKNNKEDLYGLVYNLEDSFYIIPWLGSFGGKLFKEDGIAPNLDSKAMINTLSFLQKQQIKNKTKNSTLNYQEADDFFKEGSAAMIINGDWSIKKYIEALGDNLLIGRLPKNSATGLYPSPFVSGRCFMISATLPENKEDAVSAFISFATSIEQQNYQLENYYILPGLKEAYSNPLLISDPYLSGSISQLEVGRKKPVNSKTDILLEIINKELINILDDSITPLESAKKMQDEAIKAISSSN